MAEELGNGRFVMDNDLHNRFDALVSGLEEEFTRTRIRAAREARGRFVRRAIIGGAATLVIGLWNPFVGVGCFLVTVLGVHRALCEAD